MSLKNIIIGLLMLPLLGCQFAYEHNKPEKVALAFMQAVYIDKNIEQAKQFVDQEIYQLMEHYHTPKAIQKHVLGVVMDNVALEVKNIDIDFFRTKVKDIKVQIKLDGYQDNKRRFDDRELILNKINERWVITKLNPDRFQVSG
ncbi:hypothetical protein [Paraferrimonas sp. SM1919]|uniref:hypothetical protein n=1 Tax=Paraferrimonas sp. SM1919 TaxID=2662263 RepID=UPI0013D8830F|nr:hypothetical protein [Paraferrimonas sp. SM1919]